MDIIRTDVLVIGAGAAGIRACLAASRAGVNVTLLAKRPVAGSGSTFSPISGGWGIQALIGDECTEENLEDFYNDIMRVGLGICDPKLVRILVEESGTRLEDLISYGIRFRRDSTGNYIRINGCFSEYKRAFITEDIQNIKQTFLSIIQRSSIKVVQGYAIDLLVRDNVCHGVLAIVEGSKLVMINAHATVLACGGGAAIFKDHLVSNDELGDGYALSHRAGASLANMEFIQFMLGLKNRDKCPFLPLGELTAVPHTLLDPDGHDLLEIYIPDPEARCRAVEERQKHYPFSCRDSSYLVDIAVAESRKAGKSVFWKEASLVENPTEVVHLAHAFNGGVKINEMAESTVSGLFAAGEVAAGPHGADRIGGCMMTATQVFGKRAGGFAAAHAKRSKTLSFPDIKVDHFIEIPRYACNDHYLGTYSDKLKAGNDSYIDTYTNIASGIRDTMSKYSMVLRWEKGLKLCKKGLNDYEIQLEEFMLKQSIDLKRYFELRNMIVTGRLVVESAIRRTDCLGSHYRIKG